MTEWKVGTIIRGNGNGALFEIVKVDKHIVTLKNLKDGGFITYGAKALARCDITILEGEKDGK